MNELDDDLFSSSYNEDEGTWQPAPYKYEDLPQATYSNEGKNYPTTESTQGSGGSPVNASTSGDIASILKNILNPSGRSQLLGNIGNIKDDPLKGIMSLLMLKQLLTPGGTRPTIGGYKGPGINMGLKASREPIALPAPWAYGSPAYGQKMLSDVTYAAEGKYLRGDTDGMADKIPSSIDGKQPAALSHGEFVVPADVVSHLGNGNSDAGAKVLYGMMDRVRKARTGTTKQGKRINPEKFTPGGQAYAKGGIAAFPSGGEVGPAVTTQTPGGTTTEQNLASWAGPYVMDYLSRAQALAQMPYQPYQGQLTAGTSPLQQQAFSGLAALMGGGGGYGGGYGQPQMRAQQPQLDEGFGGGPMPMDRYAIPGMRRPQGALTDQVYAGEGGAPKTSNNLMSILERAARGEDVSNVQLPQGDAQTAMAKMAPRTQGPLDEFDKFPPIGQNMSAAMGGRGGMGGGLGSLGGQGGMPAYPRQFDVASRFAEQAGQRAGQAQYTPGQFTMGQVNAPTLQDLQMQAPEAVSGAQAQASQLAGAPQVQAAQMQGPGAISPERVGAERVAAPSLQNLQMQAAAPVSAQQVGTPQMQAAQTGYQPNLQTFQMGPAQQVGTQGFTQAAAEGLMSPYMQSVVSRQQQAAQREADIASQAQKAQFAQSGAFGGSRQGVQAARAAEALARQKGDIQAQGLQSAYQQAQQQFNTQQQAAMQAALANQAAGLTTGQQNLAAQLGVQQLGTQTGTQLALANLSNQQQAAVQNQAAQLQAQGLNAQQAMQAALANQQAQQQANLQNLSAGLQTQGLQAQTGLQAQQLNQATGLQAALANQQAGMQAGQFNAQQAYNTALQNAQMQQQANLANQGLLGQYGLQQGQFGQQAALQNAQLAQQAALANQQMGYNTGLQNLQAKLGIQQLGAGQGLQAQLANQQALMQAQQAAEQSRQFGAGYGMQGIGQQLSAAGQLGQLGQGQFGTQLGGINALLGAGATQYGQEQAGLTALQNEYNKQMMWPYQQLQFQQSMMQGLPVAAQGTTPNISPYAQLSSVFKDIFGG